MCRHDSVTVWSRSAMAAVIASGSVSHNRVEASTSASSNVTVPVGSCSLTPTSLKSNGGMSVGTPVSLTLPSM
jgi:hypothetical protein